MSDVAAAEPDENAVGGYLHRRTAQDLAVPAFRSRNRHKAFVAIPVNSINRSRQADAAALHSIPAGVEHPVRSARSPHGRLPQTIFVESSGRAQLHQWIRPQLLPSHSVL